MISLIFALFDLLEKYPNQPNLLNKHQINMGSHIFMNLRSYLRCTVPIGTISNESVSGSVIAMQDYVNSIGRFVWQCYSNAGLCKHYWKFCVAVL